MSFKDARERRRGIARGLSADIPAVPYVSPATRLNEPLEQRRVPRPARSGTAAITSSRAAFPSCHSTTKSAILTTSQPPSESSSCILTQRRPSKPQTLNTSEEMTSSGAPKPNPNSPPQSNCGHSGLQQSVSSPMTASSPPGANSSSPMGSDINDVPGHRTDQPATGRSIFDPEGGTCTPAPRRRGRIAEFLVEEPPRGFSGWAPPYVSGGSMDHEVDDEEDWDEDWEEDDEYSIPAFFLGGWDSGTGQQQQGEDDESWDGSEDEGSDDEEDDVDSEGEALSRAASANRGGM